MAVTLEYKGYKRVGAFGEDCLNYGTQRFRVSAPISPQLQSGPIWRNMVSDITAKRSI
jgi:hypothetical protein